MNTTDTDVAAPAVRVIQSATDEADIVRSADPDATPEEINAAMSSCVVHLCGCDAQ